MKICQWPQCHEITRIVTDMTDLGLFEEGGGVILQAFSLMQNLLEYLNCKSVSLRYHVILVCVKYHEGNDEVSIIINIFTTAPSLEDSFLTFGELGELGDLVEFVELGKLGRNW